MALLARSEASKDAELLVLRQEVAVLCEVPLPRGNLVGSTSLVPLREGHPARLHAGGYQLTVSVDLGG